MHSPGQKVCPVLIVFLQAQIRLEHTLQHLIAGSPQLRSIVLAALGPAPPLPSLAEERAERGFRNRFQQDVDIRSDHGFAKALQMFALKYEKMILRFRRAEFLWDLALPRFEVPDVHISGSFAVVLSVSGQSPAA